MEGKSVENARIFTDNNVKCPWIDGQREDLLACIIGLAKVDRKCFFYNSTAIKLICDGNLCQLFYLI